MGELGGLFERATVVFMGGTLASRGGHNILEPAYFGKPVVAGPHMENFAAIAEEFTSGGGLVRIGGAMELAPAIAKLHAEHQERADLGPEGREIHQECVVPLDAGEGGKARADARGLQEPGDRTLLIHREKQIRLHPDHERPLERRPAEHGLGEISRGRDLRQGRQVVGAREVIEDQPAQPVAEQLGQVVRRLAIRQMAVAPGDALFQRPRVGPVAQHVEVVVGLQHHDVQVAQPRPGEMAVGAAVRDVHNQSRVALERYMRLTPVVDSVEGEYTKTSGIPGTALRLVGKVPADDTV